MTVLRVAIKKGFKFSAGFPSAFSKTVKAFPGKFSPLKVLLCSLLMRKSNTHYDE